MAERQLVQPIGGERDEAAWEAWAARWAEEDVANPEDLRHPAYPEIEEGGPADDRTCLENWVTACDDHDVVDAAAFESAEDHQYSTLGRSDARARRSGRTRRVRRPPTAARLSGPIFPGAWGSALVLRDNPRVAKLVGRQWGRLREAVRRSPDVARAGRLLACLEGAAGGCGWVVCDDCVIVACHAIRRADRWRRDPEDWACGGGPEGGVTWRPYAEDRFHHEGRPRVRHVASGLFEHLFHEYPVPRWLALPGMDHSYHYYPHARDVYADTMFEWHAHLGAGGSIRTLPRLPAPLTRAAAHVLSTTAEWEGEPDNAVWFARWLAGGLAGELARTVLRHSLTWEQRDEAAQWLMRELPAGGGAAAAEGGGVDVGHLLDYFRAVKDGRVAGQTGFGRRRLGTILREAEAWTAEMAAAAARRVAYAAPAPAPERWASCGIPGLDGHAASASEMWAVVELCSAAELSAESAAMGHCVASYAWQAAGGACAIYSVRPRPAAAGGAARPVLTVEVRLPERMVVQVRGRANAKATAAGRACVEAWAAGVGLSVAGWAF